MLKKIAHFIEQHKLLSKDKKYIVALSGGADSVCLLLVLRRLGQFLRHFSQDKHRDGGTRTALFLF